jgi:hypothetical protein
MKAPALALTFALAALAASLTSAAGQPPSGAPKAKGPTFTWPERMQNRQVFPADTGPDRLRGAMRHFAMSLGVRCTYCHVGAEGAPLTQIDFASDANPHKNVARGMMRMVEQLNSVQLPAISGLSEPRVSCFTCHRGSTEPETEPPEPSPPAQQPQPAAPAQPAPQGERGAR